MSKTAFAGPYRDTVTRYNRRPSCLLDAPRTYCTPRITRDWATITLYALTVSALIVTVVMILGAM